MIVAAVTDGLRIICHIKGDNADMQYSRDAIVYEAIQRVYRPWFVQLIRENLTRTYGADALDRLRRPFAKEWSDLVAASALSRSAGAVSTEVADDFDRLDVAHFATITEAEFDILFPGGSDEPERDRRTRRESILRYIRMVKAVRDPLSHPVEQELTIDDARMTIDSARRVARASANSAAERLGEMLQELQIATNEPLEADLPPSEVIGPMFIGREQELGELSDWLARPESRRWVLAGAGGRGKTAIAFEFASRVRISAPGPVTFVLWISAKRRRFVEGEAAEVPYADFEDLPSALDRILSAFGWATEAPNPPRERRDFALELLNRFPSLLIADDIDTVEGQDEDVAEFLTDVAYRTSTKVLLTSRRSLHGLGGATTMVRGLTRPDFESVVDGHIVRMGLDHAIFREERRQRIFEVTDGSPLFLEDLLRLANAGVALDRAIALWRDRGGDAARVYALGRELEMLSPRAKELLVAASIPNVPVTQTELEFVTERTTEEVDLALGELQRLFLVPKPRLIENAERFQLDYNTRALVRRVAAEQYPTTVQKVRAAYRAVSGEAGGAALRQRRASEYNRQAVFMMKSGDQERAEQTLLAGLDTLPEEASLVGQLAWLYKSWRPQARVTDARLRFERAEALGGDNALLYGHWIEMERGEGQWSRAIEIAATALAKYPADAFLAYQAGYAHWRFGQELTRQLQSRGIDEFDDARRILRKGLEGAPRSLDRRDLVTRSKAFNALSRCIVDELHALLAARDPEHARKIAGLRAELKETLDRWVAEHPHEPLASESAARFGPLVLNT